MRLKLVEMKSFHCSLNLAASGWWVYSNTSEAHVHEAIVSDPLPKNGSSCLGYWIEHSFNLWMVMIEELEIPPIFGVKQ